jgi:uncharacterized protein YbjT (DUF2867 family)
MLGLTSPTGKLGNAILTSLLPHNLIPKDQLILLSSSNPSPKLEAYTSQGIQVRTLNYHDPSAEAFKGITKLLLISTPEISLDFRFPENPGRESVQIATLKKAIEAGVKHVYYTSLAFGDKSDAGVMRAHLRTEEFLKGQGVKVTVLREGLYNESWPLYLGYYSPGDDERESIVLCGDGKISWTAISDLGLANALVLVAPGEEYEGKTLYLSAPKSNAMSLEEVAGFVGRVKGKDIKVKVVSREEYVRYYVEERGAERDSVEWWSTSYGALEKGECLIEDVTLEKLLKSKGVEVTKMEDTIRKMLQQ